MKERILIVEDEAIVALSLKMELETRGYKVCGFVSSGEEAIDKARAESPDLILMDINLSGEMDGIEAAEKIVSSGDARVIFFSGNSNLKIDTRIQRLQPLGLLNKPITVDMIEALLTGS